MELNPTVTARDATGFGGGVILRRSVDHFELQRRVDKKEVERVRWGAYIESTEHLPPHEARTRRALARILALSAQLTTRFWFSHESAALLWGCSVYLTDGVTYITQVTAPSGRGDRTVLRHHERLAEAECAEIDGFPVTSLERAVVDVASTAPGERALIVADSALRLGADRAEIERICAARFGRRGVARARRVIAWADARSESAGESMLRWICHNGGLGDVTPQREVATRLGVFRLDLALEGHRVGLEFDGAVKYSGAFGVAGPDAVVAEKARQDALEEEGWTIVRVTWADLADPVALVRRIRTAIRRAAAR